MKIIRMLLLLVATCGLCAGCGVTSDPITAETEEEIKQTLYNVKYGHRAEVFNFSAKDMAVTIYGSFNGSSVFYWDGITKESGFGFQDYGTAIHYETVAGQEFRYSSFGTLKVYFGGTFYDLQEAYEQGLLKKRHIKYLLNLYTDCRPELYEDERSNEALSDEDVEQLTAILTDNQFSPWEEDLYYYLGTFRGDIVFRSDSIVGEVGEYSIGDKMFSKRYTYWVLLDFSLVSLHDAYQNGDITHSELTVISERNRSGWTKSR